MQIYLVGGAVRDQLMGLASADRDYVVVGGTPEAMLAAGYRSVGKDFPVFLHPDTNEEYALARTERKSGHGYHGFIFHADPHVRLEDDLRRRDLTINAIAQDAEGRIIDPFGGVRDLRDKVLRHVSEAFVEDPVRVLRVARFAARYQRLGFRVADETLALMRRIAESGELAHLVPERTWQETRKALAEPLPSAFLQVLRGCSALGALFPEIDRLYGVPARAEHHPEVDTGIHLEMVVDMAATLAPGDALVAFAALLHDLGKGATPPVEWPAHIAHESRGVPLVRAVCARLKVPREYAQAAEHACRFHLDCHRAFELRPATVLKLLTQIDALRKPDRLRVLLLVCEADKRGRLHHRDDAYPQANYLQEALLVVRRVSAEPWVAQGLSGAALGQALQEARVAALARLREIHQKS